ncbi:MAG: hypothetical protein IJ233_07395 [Pyramidobacter sp.]|nr:hypothetical protein [Pyramidobacter sp.]
MHTIPGITKKSLSPADEITFFDSTIREGEAAPGVVFSDEEKLEIVHWLAKVGVEAMQIAYVGLDPRLKALAQKVTAVEKGLGKVVASNGLSPQIFEMIDYVADCGCDGISSAFFISPFSPKGIKDNESKAFCKQRMAQVIEKIRSVGKTPSVGLVDCTRMEPAVTAELAKVACEAGAKKITLSDTVGCATPESMYEIVSRVCEVASPFGVRIGAHCHNDFGLCLANTLAGIRAGATIACTTIDGLGERCGNASMAEVAAALELLYGVKTKINLSAMTELSRYVEHISKVPVPWSKPLVGRYAYSHKQDIHVEGLLKHPLSVQAIPASTCGNEENIIFGKTSGPHVFEYMSKKRGIEIPQSKYGKIMDKLVQLDDGAKGTIITEEQFWAVVKSVN